MSSKLRIKLDLYPALKNSNIQQTQKKLYRHNRNFVEDVKCH